jgi:hypothetical protein
LGTFARRTSLIVKKVASLPSLSEATTQTFTDQSSTQKVKNGDQDQENDVKNGF